MTHNCPKPHNKTTVRTIKAYDNMQPIHHQTERANSPQCPLYGSAVKQDMIPQVILSSS